MSNSRFDIIHHPVVENLSIALIVYSVVVFTLETIPELSGYSAFFKYSEFVVVALFSAEYLWRLKRSQQKIKFVFSFYGIVDLLSVLPFYLSFGMAHMEWIRILRLFRVFRIFKLTRFMRAADRIKLAFVQIKEELTIFLVIASTLIYLASVGIYFFEKDAQPEHFKSIIHSMWWAVVTLTTVGYGDVYPVTTGGKVFTGVILMIGLSMISIPSGLLASSFSKVFSKHDKDRP